MMIIIIIIIVITKIITIFEILDNNLLVITKLLLKPIYINFAEKEEKKFRQSNFHKSFHFISSC